MARGSYHFSAKGRASTSNDHADGRCWGDRNPTSATSSGWMKNESGLSGILSRVLGRSTTPSTTMRATWIPAGQRARAIDSARLRCPPLAEEKEADLAPALRDAVAPTKTMLPRPARFMAGGGCLGG